MSTQYSFSAPGQVGGKKLFFQIDWLGGIRRHQLSRSEEILSSTRRKIHEMRREAYSLEEAAVQLGISQRSIFRAAAEAIDPLPTFKIGSRRLVPVVELADWIERRTVRGVA